jgi:hypothetical protein
VPPTWNKTQYQTQIANVWRRAALELGQANNIITIGYSMHSTDSFFRYLFAFGSESESKVRSFIVVNPDISVKPKFESLIGPGIKKRFRFISDKFNTFAYEFASYLDSTDFLFPVFSRIPPRSAVAPPT